LEPKASAAVFNREAFLYRMMQDVHLAHTVTGGFLNDLPELIRMLKQRVAEQDIESVRKEAHKVKGAAANVGGELLSELALKMETASKAGDLAAVTARIPELEEQTARLTEAMKSWRAQIAPDPGCSVTQ